MQTEAVENVRYGEPIATRAIRACAHTHVDSRRCAAADACISTRRWLPGTRTAGTTVSLPDGARDTQSAKLDASPLSPETLLLFNVSGVRRNWFWCLDSWFLVANYPVLCHQKVPEALLLPIF